MKQDIRNFVVECEVCQCNKGETVKSPGTLQPLPIPPAIWKDISMDFITGLPKSGNKSVIMVVVDRLSKYAHFCALHHPFTASTVAQIFMDQVFKLHGMPNSIVSDRDPTFTSNFWQELFKLQGTQLHLSSAYHPRQMVKRKSSTSVWKPIWGALHRKNNTNGLNGYPSSNGGTTLHTIQPLAWILLKWYMDISHLQFSHTYRVPRRFRRLTKHL